MKWAAINGLNAVLSFSYSYHPFQYCVHSGLGDYMHFPKVVASACELSIRHI